MVVACRGYGVPPVVLVARVVRCWAGAARRMEAVLSIGPYDAEQAAGVEFGSSVPVFCAVQETQTVAGRACCGYARRDERRHEGERGLRGRSRDILVRTA